MKLDYHTKKYLELLFADSIHVELRHNVGGESFWPANADELIQIASALSDTGNLFTSLHRVEHPPAGKVNGEDVNRFTRLFFDFDPVRPKDTSSTALELEAAQQAANRLRRELNVLGWALPAIALSGNGYHLQFRIALPNTEEFREALTLIYWGLKEWHSSNHVEFDTSVRNPGRICGLYGSTKRKGMATPERPHRVSHVEVPTPWNQITQRQIIALADRFARSREAQPAPREFSLGGGITGTGDYRTLDVVAWFISLGLYHGPITGNIHAVQCPWQAEHSSSSPANHSDTVLFEADGGWPGFHCKHSHCDGRDIRDVIALYGNASAFCRAEFRSAHHV